MNDIDTAEGTDKSGTEDDFGKAAKVDVKEARLEQLMHSYTKGWIREELWNGCLSLEIHVDMNAEEPLLRSLLNEYGSSYG